MYPLAVALAGASVNHIVNNAQTYYYLADSYATGKESLAGKVYTKMTGEKLDELSNFKMLVGEAILKKDSKFGLVAGIMEGALPAAFTYIPPSAIRDVETMYALTNAFLRPDIGLAAVSLASLAVIYDPRT
jgi:hypothetical protein